MVSRWVWAQEGWLNQMGYRDFSGCGPVHLLGGTCSLFGAAFLGPRLGRFGSKFEDSQELAGHSVPVSVTRTVIVAVVETFMTQERSSVHESLGRDREDLVDITVN